MMPDATEREKLAERIARLLRDFGIPGGDALRKWVARAILDAIKEQPDD
jgi:hypothetical protein